MFLIKMILIIFTIETGNKSFKKIPAFCPI